MTFFTINHDDAQDFSPIPEGTYEVIISDVEATTSSSGNPMLKLQHTIREDVDQPAKKRKVFDNMVVTENAMFRFQNIAKATSMPNGAAFSSAEELLSAFARHLKGNTLRITIKLDKTRDQFPEQVKAYLPSELSGTVPVPGANPFQQGQAAPPAFEEPAAESKGKGKGKGKAKAKSADDGAPPWASGTPIDISEDDLPF